MKSNFNKFKFRVLIVAIFAMLPAAYSFADIKADTKFLSVPLNRSSLITLPSPMSEVMVANPDIADVHAHSSTNLTVIAKKLGITNVRIFDKEGKLLREVVVSVGYDLPAIRYALKNFLPDEVIGVEMVNTSIALTGQVSSPEAAEKAVKIVKDFIHSDGPAAKSAPLSSTDLIKAGDPEIINMLQITASQQVMLKVRVGEVNREALKTLGIDLSYLTRTSGSGIIFGTGTGIAGLATNATGTIVAPGTFVVPGDQLANTHGVLSGRWDYSDSGTVAGLIKMLERDGLFKLLAEPNLVAISGEEAEFLAGGEIPIPVVQGNAISTNNNITVEYKPFGVAVKFTPFVISDNRIRVAVQQEVSEISSENSVKVSNFQIPSISTRRSKTTVELAPGESFMVAGLIKDQVRANIDQLPGAKDLPVLGALFRSTSFQRNETELVISVTPYLVDPLKSSQVKLPTDNFRPPSQMEMLFYGSIGGIAQNPASAESGIEDSAAVKNPAYQTSPTSQTPGLEGPVGFMVD